MKEPTQRSVGRPSLATERRDEILDAFIELIAAKGLPTVTLDQVASRAGVQRSVIRHYVGNRASLIVEASSRLVERYEKAVRLAIGDEPSLGDLIAHLFSAHWRTATTVEDRAFDELYREATRTPETRDRLRHAYELLIDEVAGAIRRHDPARSASQARQTAYEIVCLAEYNAVLQQLGLPATLGRAARANALRLATTGERDDDRTTS